MLARAVILNLFEWGGGGCGGGCFHILVVVCCILADNGELFNKYICSEVLGSTFYLKKYLTNNTLSLNK